MEMGFQVKQGIKLAKDGVFCFIGSQSRKYVMRHITKFCGLKSEENE